MTLLLCGLFVGLVATFGMFLIYARPENMERPFLVGAMTTATAFLAGWLIWLESHHGDPNHHGIAFAYALFALTGFAVGRAIDMIMGPRRETADERQATLGAELAD